MNQTLAAIPINEIEPHNSRQTNFPVLAVILYPDFIEKPINGEWGKNSSLTRFPVLSGMIYPGFTKTPTKGAIGPNSRLGNSPVLGGRLEPDVNRHPDRSDRIRELDDNKLPGTSGDSRSRLYPKTNKEGEVPEIEANARPVLAGLLYPGLLETLIKGLFARTRG